MDDRFAGRADADADAIRWPTRLRTEWHVGTVSALGLAGAVPDLDSRWGTRETRRIDGSRL